VDLAVYYPHPGEWPTLTVIGAAALVLVISVLAVANLRRFPWLFVGWFWFVGTLVPVIGLVQIGTQSMADRFTYVPSIGLLLAIVWTLRHFALRHPSLRPAGFTAAVVLILIFATVTHRQAGYWKNSERLLAHAAKVTPPSALLLNSTGDALVQQGRTAEAMEKFKGALQLDPEDALAWGNVGNIQFRQGKFDEAIDNYRRGLRYNSKNAHLHHNLALALFAKGHVADAIQHHQRALALDPFFVDAYLNLGNACMNIGNTDAAVTNYLAAIQLQPNLSAAHYNLGNARLAQKRPDDAIKQFREAVRLNNTFVDAYRQLGLALQQAGRRAEALPVLQQAAALNPSSPGIRAELAALLAELGQTGAAIAQYREALNLEQNLPLVLNNLAWLLATHPDAAFRDGPDAVRMAERAVELTSRKQAFLLGTLAAAYAETGRFDDAVKTAQEAIHVAEQNGQTAPAFKNKELLAHYRERRPWREPPP
jgi:protein O-mannosyl-transferase